MGGPGSGSKHGRPMVIGERVFRALFVAGERGATSREIATEVYADRPDGGPVTADECVTYWIRKLRARIAPYDATIVSDNGSGRWNRHRLRTPRRA